MIVLSLTWFILCCGWLLLIVMYRINNGIRRRTRSQGKRLWLMAVKSHLVLEPFTQLLNYCSSMIYVTMRINMLHTEQRILRGRNWTIEHTREEVAVTIGYSYITIVAANTISLIIADPFFFWLGVIIGLLLLIRLFMSSSKKVSERRRSIITTLPSLVSRMTLLIGAGETVQRSFIKIGTQFSEEQLQAALPYLWQQAASQLQQGQTFEQALDTFNKQCVVQEVATFSTILLLNYRRGGDQLTLALKEQMLMLWETRKSIVKIKGEEASSKLVFPLVLLLFTMIVLIGTPAVMIAI